MMTGSRLRALIVLLLMCGSFGVSQAIRPSKRLADLQPRVALETLFPKQFGDWQIDDKQPMQLVAPDAQALLNKLYSETLSRVYVQQGTGRRVMLSVAYGGDQSDATRAHRPEVCYPAQGFQLLSSHDVTVPAAGRALNVRQLVTKLGTRVEPVSYWIVVGDRVALSATDQKVAQLRYGFRGVVADGMLVRVSNIDVDSPAAFALQSTFIQQLARAIPAALLPRVVGADNA